MFTKIVLLLGLVWTGFSSHAFSGCRMGDLDTTQSCTAHRQIVCERGARGFVQDSDVPAEVDVTFNDPKNQDSRTVHNVGNEIYHPSTKGYPLPPFGDLKGNLARNAMLIKVLGKIGVEVTPPMQLHIKNLSLNKKTKLYTSCAANTEVENPDSN